MKIILDIIGTFRRIWDVKVNSLMGHAEACCIGGGFYRARNISCIYITLVTAGQAQVTVTG